MNKQRRQAIIRAILLLIILVVFITLFFSLEGFYSIPETADVSDIGKMQVIIALCLSICYLGLSIGMIFIVILIIINIINLFKK